MRLAIKCGYFSLFPQLLLFELTIELGFEEEYEFPILLQITKMKLPNVSGEFMVLQAINLALPEDERTKPHNTVNLCCFPCTKMKSKSSVPFDINSFLRPIIEDFKAASSDGFDVTYKDSETTL